MKLKAIERPEEYYFSADRRIRSEIKKSNKKQWMPFEVYNLVQDGYPIPNRGEMKIETDGGTDKNGDLIAPDGEWCRVEDVLKILEQLNIDLEIEFDKFLGDKNE